MANGSLILSSEGIGVSIPDNEQLEPYRHFIRSRFSVCLRPELEPTSNHQKHGVVQLSIPHDRYKSPSLRAVLWEKRNIRRTRGNGCGMFEANRIAVALLTQTDGYRDFVHRADTVNPTESSREFGVEKASCTRFKRSNEVMTAGPFGPDYSR